MTELERRVIRTREDKQRVKVTREAHVAARETFGTRSQDDSQWSQSTERSTRIDECPVTLYESREHTVAWSCDENPHWECRVWGVENQQPTAAASNFPDREE